MVSGRGALLAQVLVLVVLLFGMAAGPVLAAEASLTAAPGPAEAARSLGTVPLADVQPPSAKMAPAGPGASATPRAPSAATPSPASALPAPALPAPALPAPALPATTVLGEQIQALVTGEEGLEIEPEETFGTRALALVMTFFEVLRERAVFFAQNFSALTQFSAWFDQQSADPVLRERWRTILGHLALVLGPGALVGGAAFLLFTPLRRRLASTQPPSFAGRLGTLLVWLFVGLLPILLFLATSGLALKQADPPRLVRFVVANVVYAVAFLALVRVALRFLLAPKAPLLRLLPLTTPQAVWLKTWGNAFGAVLVLAWFVLATGRLVRVPATALDAAGVLAGLLVTLMALVMATRKRAGLSALLRGRPPEPGVPPGLWTSFRRFLARVWYPLTLAYLVVGALVTTLGAAGGFQKMLRGTLATLGLLALVWAALYLVRRLGPSLPAGSGPGITRPVLQFLLRLGIWTAGGAGVAAAWGADVGAFFASAWGQRILGSAATIGTTLVLVVLAYEAMQAAIERRLNRCDAGGRPVESGVRARTLLPMLRNAAIIVLAVVVGFVTLSELGINIAPLLAGAGVIGVAVGFGSQTLVKDFLTGLFIVLEDTIAVGDVVSIGDHSGTVEGMTIRTVRLRDVRGHLHILPFSEISKLINQTKGFSFAVMDVGVAYESDLRRVMEVMRRVGEELRGDPVVGPLILEAPEVTGVEAFAESSVTLRCRLRTFPGKQWEVRRAYLLRLKESFDSEGIMIPYPTVMQLQRG